VFCVYCVIIVFFSVNCVICVFLQYFDTVGWVFWPVKTVARITYTVLLETLNPAQSINQRLECEDRKYEKYFNLSASCGFDPEGTLNPVWYRSVAMCIRVEFSNEIFSHGDLW